MQLCDDLNTPQRYQRIHRLASEIEYRMQQT